jgi:ketosteroid isomerase-like protein
MKATKALVAGLAIVGIAALLRSSRLAYSAQSDKAEIVEFDRLLIDAYSSRDIDAVMKFYIDDKDAVFFEDTIPFQFEGKRALGKFNAGFFRW